MSLAIRNFMFRTVSSQTESIQSGPSFLLLIPIPCTRPSLLIHPDFVQMGVSWIVRIQVWWLVSLDIWSPTCLAQSWIHPPMDYHQYDTYTMVALSFLIELGAPTCASSYPLLGPVPETGDEWQVLHESVTEIVDFSVFEFKVYKSPFRIHLTAVLSILSRNGVLRFRRLRASIGLPRRGRFRCLCLHHIRNSEVLILIPLCDTFLFSFPAVAMRNIRGVDSLMAMTK